MKKMFLMAMGLLSLFGFAACNMDGGDDGGENNGTGFSAENIAQKKALYARIVGTSWKNYFYNDDTVNQDNLGIIEISFAEDSITIDGTQISLNQNKDFYFYDELDENSVRDNTSLLSIKIDEKVLCLSGYLIDSNYSYDDNMLSILQNYKLSKASNEGEGEYKYTYDQFRLVSSSSSKGENTTSELNGTYAFNTAFGSQVNGSIKLDDGAWSYTGNKSNVAASSGTYTVNGSKITMKWTATTDLEEVFTVSTSGSSSTWTSEETVVSNLFAMLFGVTSTEMTFDYSEAE